GLPAFAVSVACRMETVHSEDDPAPRLDFAPAARFSGLLAERLVANGLPRYTMLNVNVPRGEPKGVEVTRQGVRRYPGKVERRLDPNGPPYYWRGGYQPEDRLEPGSDVHAIEQRRISVTPIQLDLTD